MSDLSEALERAVSDGRLLATSAENILQLLARENNPVYLAAVEELIVDSAEGRCPRPSA